MKLNFSKTGAAAVVILAGFLVSIQARAQSDVSALSAVSALPVASVLVASEAAGAVAQASAVLSVAGGTLIVKAVQSTARGSVYVLERVSDGVRVSVEVGAKALGRVVTVSVIAAGTALLVAGEVIAFVPNEVGRALLYNRRLSN